MKLISCQKMGFICPKTEIESLQSSGAKPEISLQSNCLIRSFHTRRRTPPPAGCGRCSRGLSPEAFAPCGCVRVKGAADRTHPLLELGGRASRCLQDTPNGKASLALEAERKWRIRPFCPASTRVCPFPSPAF